MMRMKKIISSAIASRIVSALGDATHCDARPVFTQRSYSDRECISDSYVEDQMAVHARVDSSQPDRIAEAVEKGASVRFTALGNNAHVEMRLKPNSLLQCPLTTVQVPDGWPCSPASTAKPV